MTLNYTHIMTVFLQGQIKKYYNIINYFVIQNQHYTDTCIYVHIIFCLENFKQYHPLKISSVSFINVKHSKFYFFRVSHNLSHYHNYRHSTNMEMILKKWYLKALFAGWLFTFLTKFKYVLILQACWTFITLKNVNMQ